MTVMSAIKIELRAYLKKIKPASAVLIQFFREFDPGAGQTLAACLTHASRTKHCARRRGVLAQIGVNCDDLVADG